MAKMQPDLFSLPHQTMNAPLDRHTVLAKVDLIVEAYKAGVFGDTTHEVHPDIDKSSLAWRLYFTLPCAINYQRKSENLWRSALNTFDDNATRFVFDCSNVALGFETYRSALAAHGLALQREKQSLIWFTISKTLWDHFGGDPLNLFELHDFQIAKIKNFVTSNKPLFPYVSGPKLLNYWLYIFMHFNDVQFTGKEEISVIPDVHVKRATVELSLMNEKSSEDTEAVAELWSGLLKDTAYAPCDIHAPLWRWSRAGFPSPESLLTSSKQKDRRTAVAG